MSKKTLIETRDIAKTLDESNQTPAAISAWKSFKEIKIDALTAIINATAQAENAKKEPAENLNVRNMAAEIIEADNSGKILDKYKQYASDINLGIENARIRRNFDKFGLNAAITSYIKDISGKYPENSKPDYTHEEQIQRGVAMNNRVRVGNLVSEYLRCFCEEIVNDIAHVAIESALRAKRKIVLVSHIFDANGFYLKPARFLNLFNELPAFIDAQTKFADKDNRAMAAKIVLSYLGEFARNLTNRDKYDLIRANIEQYLKSDALDASVSDASDIDANANAVAAATTEATSAEETSTTKKKKDARFSFYIKKMLSVIRDSDPRYEGMRFNHDLTPFIDTILNEFIQIVAVRSIVYITTMEIQTVSTSIIRAIILGMMIEPKSLFERTMTIEKVNQEWESRIAMPNIVAFIDAIYPLGPRVHHPRKQVNNAPNVQAKQPEPESAPAPVPVPTQAQPTQPAQAQKQAQAKAQPTQTQTQKPAQAQANKKKK